MEINVPAENTPVLPDNPVMATLRTLVEKADGIYIPVGRSSMLLSDPKLPTKDGAKFIRDRLAEIPDDSR
jgi:hypothetical protein